MGRFPGHYNRCAFIGIIDDVPHRGLAKGDQPFIGFRFAVTKIGVPLRMSCYIWHLRLVEYCDKNLKEGMTVLVHGHLKVWARHEQWQFGLVVSELAILSENSMEHGPNESGLDTQDPFPEMEPETS